MNVGSKASQLVSVFLPVLGALTITAATAIADASLGYRAELDVVYGNAIIAPDGVEVERDLRMDVYYPDEANADFSSDAYRANASRAAVIYFHGGAHHRGGRRQEPFRLEAAVHSRPEDYARLLAPLGYVVFVVEYRLATENPVPTLLPGEANLLEDIDGYVTPEVFAATVRARNAMGLQPLPDTAEGRRFLWDAGVSAAEDVRQAFDFVVENSERFGVDPVRIAMGGHSAGGGITMNVAYGLQTPLAAVFPLSGPDILFEHQAVIQGGKLPPTLLVYSQFDEHTQLGQLPGIVDMMKESGVDYHLAWVPGFAHFFPHGAVSLADDGTRKALSDRIIEFLAVHLAP